MSMWKGRHDRTKGKGRRDGSQNLNKEEKRKGKIKG